MWSARHQCRTLECPEESLSSAHRGQCGSPLCSVWNCPACRAGPGENAWSVDTVAHLLIRAFSSSSVNDHWPQSWPLPSFLVHAGLFCCFHSPPNSDMDCKIFNVSVIFLHAYKHGGPRFVSLIQRTFVESTQNFDSGEISGWVQSLAHNGHPSIWWPHSLVLNPGFRERVLYWLYTELNHNTWCTLVNQIQTMAHDALILHKEEASEKQVNTVIQVSELVWLSGKALGW